MLKTDNVYCLDREDDIIADDNPLSLPPHGDLHAAETYWSLNNLSYGGC
jgi:hypothetical protein